MTTTPLPTSSSYRAVTALRSRLGARHARPGTSSLVSSLQMALGWLQLDCPHCTCRPMVTDRIDPRRDCPGAATDGCTTESQVRARAELARAGILAPWSTRTQLALAVTRALLSHHDDAHLFPSAIAAALGMPLPTSTLRRPS